MWIASKVVDGMIADYLAPSFLPSLLLFVGSASECISQLVDYGIPSDLVPIDPATGSLHFEQFMTYVDERETVEALSKERTDKEHEVGGSSGDKILVPTRNDGTSLNSYFIPRFMSTAVPLHSRSRCFSVLLFAVKF